MILNLVDHKSWLTLSYNLLKNKLFLKEVITQDIQEMNNIFASRLIADLSSVPELKWS